MILYLKILEAFVLSKPGILMLNFNQELISLCASCILRCFDLKECSRTLNNHKSTGLKASFLPRGPLRVWVPNALTLASCLLTPRSRTRKNPSWIRWLFQKVKSRVWRSGSVKQLSLSSPEPTWSWKLCHVSAVPKLLR